MCVCVCVCVCLCVTLPPYIKRNNCSIYRSRKVPESSKRVSSVRYEVSSKFKMSKIEPSQKFPISFKKQFIRTIQKA